MNKQQAEKIADRVFKISLIWFFSTPFLGGVITLIFPHYISLNGKFGGFLMAQWMGLSFGIQFLSAIKMKVIKVWYRQGIFTYYGKQAVKASYGYLFLWALLAIFGFVWYLPKTI
jgi:hypothetical protein